MSGFQKWGKSDPGSWKPAPEAWLWCLGWLLIIWFGLASVDHFSTFFARTNSAQVSNFPAFPKGQVRVIALGDSLLRRSTPESGIDGDERWQTQQWSRLWASASSWKDFVPMLQRLKVAQAELILVQDSVFLSPYETSLPTRIRLNLAQMIRAGLGRASLAGVNPAPHEISHQMGASMEQRLKRVVSQKYRDSLPLEKGALELLVQLKTLARQVVVVHLPRRADFEGLPEVTLWRQALAQTLANLDVEYLSVGSSLSSNQYTDGSHPNIYGRKTRIRQFNKLINDRLNTSRDRVQQ